MRNNSGKSMSIYSIPQIVRDTLPLAATPKTFQLMFRDSGVWLTNKNIFTEGEYLSSDVIYCLALCPYATSSLSLEVGKPQVSEGSIVREITPPPSTTICDPSATIITTMDAPCC